MYNIMLMAFMILATCVAVVLSAIVLIIGVFAVVALLSKFVDILKGGKPKSGGQ